MVKFFWYKSNFLFFQKQNLLCRHFKIIYKHPANFYALQALQNEGENPEEYLFEISKGKPAKVTTPKKAQEVEKESDPVVPENVSDEQPVESTTEATVDSTNEKNEDEVKNGNVEKNNSENVQEEEEKMDFEPDVNIEDSLNLTIGEEEEQLLRDDDDIKPKEGKLNKFFFYNIHDFIYYLDSKDDNELSTENSSSNDKKTDRQEQ